MSASPAAAIEVGACVELTEAEIQSNALVAFHDRLTSMARTERLRREQWARPTVTAAYTDLIFAWGHARLGDAPRSCQLIARARPELRSDKDPVHEWLIAAFEARVEQALMQIPPEASLPRNLLVRRAGLNRVARYKVNVLVERLRILDPIQCVDAIGEFSNSGGAPVPILGALLTVADPRARGRALVSIFESHQCDTDEERAWLLESALDTLLAGPDAATPVLRQLSQAILDLPSAARTRFYAKALLVAEQIADPDLSAELLGGLCAAIRSASARDVAFAVELLVPVLRRHQSPFALTELLVDALDRLVAIGPDVRARLAVAGGLLALGDASALAGIDDVAREYRRCPPADRYAVLKSLGRAYSYAALSERLDRLDAIFMEWGRAADSLSTRTHFCQAALVVVETVVMGVVPA